MSKRRGLRMTLTEAMNLTPTARDQIRRQLAGSERTASGRQADGKRTTRQPKQPNKTEAAYQLERLRGQDARYEAVTFRLANGHRYTPDWVIVQDGQIIACHEVKGSYRFHSEGRARLAFDQARLEYPGIRWVWARRKKGGGWTTRNQS